MYIHIGIYQYVKNSSPNKFLEHGIGTASSFSRTALNALLKRALHLSVRKNNEFVNNPHLIIGSMIGHLEEVCICIILICSYHVC